MPTTTSICAGGQLGEQLLPLGPGDAVGEQCDAQLALGEQRVVAGGHHQTGEIATEPDGVLLGEHLGGRHHRRLVSTLHRREQRGDRDDGLAGTHVALQESVHRDRPGRDRRVISPITRSCAPVSGNARRSK